MNSDEESNNLYRFEYYEPEDERTYVDWIWLNEQEVSDYRSSYNQVKTRRATKEEEDLYNEAYADGYGVAAMVEFTSQYDGITFRLNMSDDGKFEMLESTKMFECATCGNHKDFENDVATANDFYLGLVKDDKLWHVCYDCATLQMEVDGINFDITEEGEASS